MNGGENIQNQRIEAIISKYEGILLRYAARVVNNYDAAQDIVQEVFIRLCEKWCHELENNENHISSWLLSVAHNCCVDHIRKESRLSRLHKDESANKSLVTDAEINKKHSEVSDQAHMALDCLEIRERQIVVLKVFEEKSYREISEITGLSETNIGFILHNSMKKMADALQKANGK